MTITLDLKPEIEQGLRAQAYARGLSLDEFLEDVVTRAGSSQNQRPIWDAIAQSMKDVPPEDMAAGSLDSASQAEAAGPAAVRPFWEMILDSMKDTPQDVLDRLPHDGAAEHDHYIYGTPKKYS